MIGQLFLQFLIIGLLAFGGGQAALPLVERVSVAQMGWLTPAGFAAALAFSYITPGPILIVATFVGYIVGGIPGAIAATAGAFLAPAALSMGAAAGVERFAGNRWLSAFGKGALPAVLGLLGATAWDLARHAVTSWPLALVALVALPVLARTKVSPVWLLLAGAIVGWVLHAATVT